MPAPRVWGADKRAEVFRLYQETDLTYRGIGLEAGVPHATAQDWLEKAIDAGEIERRATWAELRKKLAESEAESRRLDQDIADLIAWVKENHPEEVDALLTSVLDSHRSAE